MNSNMPQKLIQLRFELPFNFFRYAWPWKWSRTSILHRFKGAPGLRCSTHLIQSSMSEWPIYLNSCVLMCTAAIFTLGSVFLFSTTHSVNLLLSVVMHITVNYCFSLPPILRVCFLTFLVNCAVLIAFQYILGFVLHFWFMKGCKSGVFSVQQYTF
jgi:hypothetical protein